MIKKKPSFGCILECLCTLLLLIGSYSIFYQMTIREGSDIGIHAIWAAEGNFHELDSFFHHGAHPMWHVLVAMVMRLGLSREVASALITSLCKAAQLPLAVWVMNAAVPNKLNRTVRTVLAMICLLVSSVRLSGYNPTVYFGAGTPNCWHSCTQTIALVWMLICVPVVAKGYDEFADGLSMEKESFLIPWKKQLGMGLLLLLSLLAKPTFMQAFLPAACIFYLISWIRNPKASGFYWQTIVCVMPAVMLMIAQYLYYFGIIVPSQGNMILQVNDGKLVDTIIRAVLLLAFPLYTLFSARREEKNTLFWLTLLMNSVAIIEYLILGEDGRRAMDGNFGWGMMGAALMAWVVSVPRFFSDLKTGFAFRHVPGIILLIWHLASGIYYIIYLMSNPVLL